jgi:hypothetical protein
MIKQHYSININAPVNKVRDIMLSDTTYRQWTTEFNSAGSRYEGDRSEGSKILFLWPDPSNPENIGGMVSRIAANKLHKFVSIEHIGIISNGVEDTTSDMVKARAGSHENYAFSEKDGITTVDVELDITQDFVDAMDGMRPKALTKLKELCEE